MPPKGQGKGKKRKQGLSDHAEQTEQTATETTGGNGVQKRTKDSGGKGKAPQTAAEEEGEYS